MTLIYDRPADPATRASVLVESLKYISQFRGRRMVVKAGGGALSDPVMMADFVSDVFMMHAVGIRPIVVHGGGPQINEMMSRLGIETAFIDGHRVTDATSLDVTRMVLVGKVNRDIVGGINAHGRVALGLSGEDLGLLTTVPRDPELGYVGDVVDVETSLIERLLQEGLVPVIATIGTDASGHSYNINADLGASAVAAAVGADKLIYLTDVDGILADVANPDSLVREASVSELQDLVAAGVVSSGMLPKVEGCIQAISGGVHRAHILNGATRHALLVELLTDEGIGTMVEKEPR